MSIIAYIVSMGNGMEPFIYREVEYLYKKGLQVILFATKFKSNDIYSPKPEWKFYRFRIPFVILFFPILFLKHPSRNFRFLIEAFKCSTVPEFMIALHYSNIMKRIGIKKIHCHFGDRKLFIGYLCKRILQIPLSVTIHAHEFVTNPNEQMFRRVLPYCDSIIAISERNKNTLVNEYSVQPEKIKVIRLFVDVEQYRQEHKRRILWVGRFVSEKRLDILLKAIKKLDREDVELIIIGFGPEDPKKIAEELGIRDRVVVFGKMNQRQLSFFYEKCDIFCLSSEREGIPVVLMEAMASGMPVVSTDVGAVSELVKNGIMVEANSPDALASGLKSLLDDEDLRRKMKQVNREIIQTTYSLENLDALFEIFLTPILK